MKNFTMSKMILILFISLTNILFAQKLENEKLVFGKAYTIDELKDANGIIRCASTGYEKYLQAVYPDRMTESQFEAWINPLIENAKQNKSQNGGIITIPVVVHVIHSGQAYGVAPNITDTQVQSQITVMNNDYRKLTGTPGFNSNPVGADVMIQFALAKVDPFGNPTNGIDRVNLCYASWTQAGINSYVKPKTIWDPTKYMNMWSVQFGGSSSNLLGYAQFPSNSGLAGLNTNGGLSSTDGVVANYATFGSTDYNDGTFIMSAPYDKGRTMTHEVGHFLGLRHIWGDASCGTDYCIDTPTAHTANYVCNKSIVSCDNPSVFEMVENYMDYTNDTCMNIFTINQKDRITAVMNNSPRRVELKTSVADIAIPLFANDGEVKLETNCSTANSTCGGTASTTAKISLYNRGTSNMTSAVITFGVGTNIQTYNWAGNLAPNRYALVDLPIPGTTPTGTMTVTVTTVNGVADQRASNNSFNTYFVGSGAVGAGQGTYTFNLQRDYYGTEITWDLKNSAGIVLYSGGPYADTPTTGALPAIDASSWALTPGCYTFTINDSFGDGIYDTGGYYNLKDSQGNIVFQGSRYTTTQTRAINVTVLATGETKSDQFAIYPNPADDVLNITKVSDEAKFEIHNAVGQLVKTGEIKSNQVKVAELVKGTYIITIKDKAISQSIKFIKK
ncbi:M43 family zinc metalloprotease [Chryseobacterium chendengshani]|uniref:M43 family zinc metalloprotease n=1 Tax=unclassified Chryseobacterium TaxID=2593645 RepID=UPI001C63FB96|nr:MULTISPECIES: M43 family zinc metalloprotease [unclassified Chryseobacterium]MBW7675823.1 T9SS type A sorting domain-containing protein [Chryseobacterium sp. LJ756]MBW8524798.1 T9SS type A sorting domain-containing protein [Chryseobacterium sp. LJ668]QYK15181.1 T9SS type A sorting domain-containing protein [Chryseobacterium sp. LJ668]